MAAKPACFECTLDVGTTNPRIQGSRDTVDRAQVQVQVPAAFLPPWHVWPWRLEISTLYTLYTAVEKIEGE